MAFNATLDGSTATITVTTINNTANLKVEDAANLADQLSAFAHYITTAPVDNTPAYMVYPTETGIRIINSLGQIDLPWRWIIPISNQLQSDG